MNFSESLLAWYDAHRRELPWRGTQDPYRIWLSEIMLQQTRTETVTRYYARFLEQFPTVMDLARADEETVLKLWEGLGYYSRARNLHAAAKKVAFEMNGIFPGTAEGLRMLPGVGPYAANAIASIAYGECVPALDGNQARVFSRITAHESPLKTPFDLLEPAMERISCSRPGDYNQALMDLGANVCTPKKPECERCPVASFCAAHAAGDPESFPRKAPPIIKKEAELTVAVVRCEDGIFVRRRAERGLLRGMYEFVLLEGILSQTAAQTALEKAGFVNPQFVRSLPPAKHVFTHLIWRMQGMLFTVGSAPEEYRLIRSVDEVPIPSALRVYREIAAEILNEP